MPTPRSESISKARDGETFIREPTTLNESENKIDHYAVLSQVINNGVDRYLSNPEFHATLASTHSLSHLDANLRFDLNQVIQLTLEDTQFSSHHQSLITSAEQRRSTEGKPWSDISENIKAGVGTFISVNSYLFSILNSRVGPEAAAQAENWKILDKLAKLHLSAFSSYFRTYFLIHQNHTRFINQLQKTKTGGYIFEPGFPLDAPVNVAATPSYTGVLDSSSLILNYASQAIAVKDIPLHQATIGCPITFEPEVLEKLWDTYATQAYRIATTPAIAIDDTEASRQ